MPVPSFPIRMYPWLQMDAEILKLLRRMGRRENQKNPSIYEKKLKITL